MVAALLAERADDKEEVAKLLAENRQLVDMVLALAQPVALREYRREAAQPPAPPQVAPRPRFPGLNPPRRPAGPLYEPSKQESEALLDAAVAKLGS
jgi:hypothetical protein